MSPPPDTRSGRAASRPLRLQWRAYEVPARPEWCHQHRRRHPQVRPHPPQIVVAHLAVAPRLEHSFHRLRPQPRHPQQHLPLRAALRSGAPASDAAAAAADAVASAGGLRRTPQGLKRSARSSAECCEHCVRDALCSVAVHVPAQGICWLKTESEAAGVGTSGKGAKRDREGEPSTNAKGDAKPRVKKEKKETATAKTKPKGEPRTPSTTAKKERRDDARPTPVANGVKVPATIKTNAKKEPRPLNSLAANGPVTPADRGDVKRPAVPGSSSGKKSRLGSESDLLDGLAAVPFALVSNSRRKSRPKKSPHA